MTWRKRQTETSIRIKQGIWTKWLQQATLCSENVTIIFYKLKYVERGNITFFYMLFFCCFPILANSVQPPLFPIPPHSLSSKRKQPNKITFPNSLYNQDIICFLYLVYQITVLTADGIDIWKYDSLTGIKKYKQINK